LVRAILVFTPSGGAILSIRQPVRMFCAKVARDRLTCLDEAGHLPIELAITVLGVVAREARNDAIELRSSLFGIGENDDTRYRSERGRRVFISCKHGPDVGRLHQRASVRTQRLPDVPEPEVVEPLGRMRSAYSARSEGSSSTMDTTSRSNEGRSIALGTKWRDALRSAPRGAKCKRVEHHARPPRSSGDRSSRCAT